MKLSGKTLELNICSQASKYVSSTQNIFWFGPTQKQEAKAGFDACTKLGGRLLIFQFKASARLLKSKERVFLAPHDQLDALRNQVKSCSRSAFYAFPLIGSTFELKNNPDLLSQTWLVDLASLSTVGPPTKSDGTLRKNGCHNVYVTPGKAVFHSNPVETIAIGFGRFIQEGLSGSDGINWAFEQNFSRFWELARNLSYGARGAVLW